VLLYELMAHDFPFKTSSSNICALAFKIVKGKYPALPGVFSDGLKAVVAQLLKVDPVQRPDIDQIMGFSIIRDVWLTFPECDLNSISGGKGKDSKQSDTQALMQKDRQRASNQKNEKKDDGLIGQLGNQLRAGDIVVTDDGRFYQKNDMGVESPLTPLTPKHSGPR
jgi:hypothetical protein